jgi:hypothetical protein
MAAARSTTSLIALDEVGGEAGAVASGSLHRPGPQRPVLCGQLDQRLIARWIGTHRHLGEDSASGVAAPTTAAVWVCL